MWRKDINNIFPNSRAKAWAGRKEKTQTTKSLTLAELHKCWPNFKIIIQFSEWKSQTLGTM